MNLINVPIALGAGLLSITSPCCLPLLPGWLGYLTGMSSTELGDRRWRAVSAALLFVAGFTVVFAALGATASTVGEVLLVHRQLFTILAGAFILTMGLVILLEGRLRFLARSGTWGRASGNGRLWAAAP